MTAGAHRERLGYLVVVPAFSFAHRFRGASAIAFRLFADIVRRFLGWSSAAAAATAFRPRFA